MKNISWFPQSLKSQAADQISDQHLSVTWIYGDSFVSAAPSEFTWFNKWTADRGPWIVNQSHGGQGPEHTVWLWHRDHCQRRHRPNDWVLICLSEISRQFQDNIPDLNFWTGMHPSQHSPQWQAIRDYYLHMAPRQEAIWPIRQQSLELWLDREISKSPAQTVIAHSFPLYLPGETYHHSRDLEANRVIHRYQNALEMWPCLSYWSVRDPDFTGDIANDTRHAHMSPTVHREIYTRIQQRGWQLCEIPAIPVINLT